jgi:hypothetical protein
LRQLRSCGCATAASAACGVMGTSTAAA